MWNYSLLIFRSTLLFSFMEIFSCMELCRPHLSHLGQWKNTVCWSADGNVRSNHQPPIFPTSGLFNKMPLWVEHTCWASYSIAMLYLCCSFSVASSLLCPAVLTYMANGKGNSPTQPVIISQWSTNRMACKIDPNLPGCTGQRPFFRA